MIKKFCFLLFFSCHCLFAGGLSTLTPEKLRALEAHLDWDYLKPLSRAEIDNVFQLLKQFEGRGATSDRPRLILTAGAMSAGKTTVFNRLIQLNVIPEKDFLIIDPDESKRLIMQSQAFAEQSAFLTPSDFHLLSIYMSDVLLEWGLADRINTIYMTSLRHAPSANKLISHVRSGFPDYSIEVFHVRSPVTELIPRMEARAVAQGRRVPPELVLESARQVDATVRQIRRLVDSYVLVSNDQHRPPRVAFESAGNRFCMRGAELGSDYLSFCSLATGRVNHIILDVDWTLFYWIYQHDQHQKPREEDTIRLNPAAQYRPADGLKEFMEVLLHTPGIILSAYSGGERARNEELFRRVELKDGTNLYERIYRILSQEDLVENLDGNSHHKKKKDLRLVDEGVSLEDIVHIDDLLGIIFPDQIENVLHLGRTFYYRENWVPHIEHRFEPESWKAWALERNKLAYVLGVILEALDLQKEKGISIKSAVKSVISDPLTLAPIDREDPRSLRFYLRGKKAMDEVNPHWQKVPLPNFDDGQALQSSSLESCGDTLKSLQKSPLPSSVN